MDLKSITDVHIYDAINKNVELFCSHFDIRHPLTECWKIMWSPMNDYYIMSFEYAQDYTWRQDHITLYIERSKFERWCLNHQLFRFLEK